MEKQIHHSKERRKLADNMFGGHVPKINIFPENWRKRIFRSRDQIYHWHKMTCFLRNWITAEKQIQKIKTICKALKTICKALNWSIVLIRNDRNVKVNRNHPRNHLDESI